MMTKRFGLKFAVILVAAVAISALFTPSRVVAFESKKTNLLVLGVESDTFEDADRAAITTALRTSLAKYSNIALLPTPTEQILDFVMELECGDIDAECFQRIADKYKADQVLYTDATGTSAAPALAMKVYDRKKNTIVKQAKGSGAGAKALGALLVQAIGALPVVKPKEPVKPPPPKKPSKVVVTLTSNVPGAVVTMSGVKLGPTPVTRKLKPGRYTVKVAKAGFTELVQKVVVEPGEKQAIAFTLVKKAAPVAEVKPKETPKTVAPTVLEQPPFYTQWWFWTAVGVGLAGIVTTAVMLSSDDELAPTNGTVNFGIASPDYDPEVRGAQ